MNIIICGAGVVGEGIARHLSNEDNNITVIDENPMQIEKIRETLDVKAVCGRVAHPPVLEEAGAKDADMIIAVTHSDEQNMVVCQIAYALFKVPMKVARIRHENYLEPQWKSLYKQKHLPIDVIISPEMEVAKALYQLLSVPGAMDTITFSEGKVKMISLRCTLSCPVKGKRVEELAEYCLSQDTQIVGIERNQQFVLPIAEDRLLEDDEIFLVTTPVMLGPIMEYFGLEEQEAHRVVIVGGGNVGLYLADLLEKETEDVHVKVIEVNPERAEYIAEKLGHTMVINGSGLDREILEEAYISTAETILAISNDDEVNILSSLLAKRFGCKRAVTLINKPQSYLPLVDSLGIDVSMSPREITVSSILQHVRRGGICAVHSLADGKAEIVEVNVMDNTFANGKTIADLKLPDEVVVAALIREDMVMVSFDAVPLKTGDHLIILSLHEVVKKLEDCFRERYEYF